MITADHSAPDTDPGFTPAATAVPVQNGRFREETPLEARRREPVVPPADTEAPRKAPSWMRVATGIRILAALGFVAAAAVGGIVANYYEFSTRETTVIAALLGIFGASLGAIIPPLTKAMGWILLCAAIALIGIGSLRLLGLLVPEFLERVLG